jgi:hypothetical protein
LAIDELYGDGLGGSQNQESLTGLRVSGLAPGVYDIFATVYIESPTNLSAATGSVWFGTGDGTVAQTNQVLNAINRPWSGFTATATDFVSTAGEWNYISNRVTIASVTDYIVLIASLPFSAGNQGAFEPIVSTLQIVAIPEPSTFALVGLGLLLFVRRRR